MEKQYFRTNSWSAITDEFIRKTFLKYHYSDFQFELFKNVAWAVRTSIKDQEAAEIIFDENTMDVSITLGTRLDTLIENYKKKNQLLEAVMATDFSSAILMKTYANFEKTAKEHFNWKGVSYHFWGDRDLDINGLKYELPRFEHIGIKCNEGMNLLPTQSVVFRLSEGCADGNICKTCERGKNGKCEFEK